MLLQNNLHIIDTNKLNKAEAKLMDEKIKIYGCRYVCEYSDGMPLSSSEHIFRKEEERAEFLSEYDEDEIDIDTSNEEYGWEFWEEDL